MRKRTRIQIRRAILVTAFAALIGAAMVAPAAAYEDTGNETSTSQPCGIDSRLLHSDPHTCSQPVFSDFTKSVEPAPAQQSTSSGTSEWAIYSSIAAALLAAAGLFALRHHPQLAS